MKKLFYLIIVSVFLFSCNENRKETPAATDESAEQGSGNNITPQLEQDTRSRYNVDTVTSPGDDEEK